MLRTELKIGSNQHSDTTQQYGEFKNSALDCGIFQKLKNELIPNKCRGPSLNDFVS